LISVIKLIKPFVLLYCHAVITYCAVLFIYSRRKGQKHTEYAISTTLKYLSIIAKYESYVTLQDI